MNRNQRRMVAYNAMKSAQALELSNYTRKIDNAFSRLSGEAAGRVAKALSGTLSLRSKREESGSACLPEVAIFAAGHRTSRKEAVHIFK